MGFIYKITNNITKKIYIGQTTMTLYNRWEKHKSVARTKNYNKSALYDSMNKHGFENFLIEVHEECKNELLEEREKFWIKELNSLVPNGYNITHGGKSLAGELNPFFGKTHSDETKQKISDKNKGRIQSDKERQMRSAINLGEKNPFYGKTHTSDAIEKIKKQFTLQRREELSNRMKENNPAKKVAVNMLDSDGNILKEFFSVKEAAEYILEQKLSKTTSHKTIVNSISLTINGKQNTSYGYNWKIKSEDL